MLTDRAAGQIRQLRRQRDRHRLGSPNAGPSAVRREQPRIDPVMAQKRAEAEARGQAETYHFAENSAKSRPDPAIPQQKFGPAVISGATYPTSRLSVLPQ